MIAVSPATVRTIRRDNVGHRSSTRRLSGSYHHVLRLAGEPYFESGRHAHGIAIVERRLPLDDHLVAGLDAGRSLLLLVVSQSPRDVDEARLALGDSEENRFAVAG